MRLLVLSACLLLTACADSGDPAASHAAAPSLETAADSSAARLVEAHGGMEAFETLPYLSFTFGFERDGVRQPLARHTWDRAANRYRAEWPIGGPADSVYVALFADWPSEGVLYRGGLRLDSLGDGPALALAERRTINDTYWLLAPLKVFDPGVSRRAAPDSAEAAFRIAFEGVGLTPGDQYWLFLDPGTGRLDRWTFVLESNPAPRSFRWTGYETLDGPRGPVHLATRKEPVAGGNVLLTDDLSADPPDETLFTDPRPRLAE